MATKKAASTAKKSTVKKPIAKKQATTKVTTIKAVESTPVHKTVAAANPATDRRFGLMRTPVAAALIAEFLATFVFAAVFIAGQGQPIIALFALAGVVFTFGTISGGYANPALVIGAWVTRRMTGLRALGYIIAQILGAMLALVILNAFVHAVPTGTDTLTSGAPALFKAAAIPKGHEWFIFLSEFIGTMVLGFAVANAFRTRIRRTASAFTYGLGAFLGLMVAGSAAAYLSATAILNPAVAISLQAIDFNSVWPIGVYVIGSALGAIVGFILFDLLRSAEVEERA